MLYNLLRDIFVFSLTFIVNFLIVSTFWGLIELFSPIRWQWLQEGDRRVFGWDNSSLLLHS